MNVIEAAGLCGSNFVVTPISLHETTCGLEQGIEINKLKAVFEFQIGWSDLINWDTACTQNDRHRYECSRMYCDSYMNIIEAGSLC